MRRIQAVCSGPPVFVTRTPDSHLSHWQRAANRIQHPTPDFPTHISEGCQLVYSGFFNLLTFNRADLGAVTFAFRQTGRRACRAANSCHLSSSLIYENLCI